MQSVQPSPDQGIRGKYQIRVSLTRTVNDQTVQQDHAKALEPTKPVETTRSFLRDFENDERRAYGCVLAYDDEMKMSFFASSKDEEGAIELGSTISESIKVEFPGAETRVDLVQLTADKINVKKTFYEVVFPRAPFRGKFKLVERVVELLQRFPGMGVEFYFLWRAIPDRRQQHVRDKLIRKPTFDHDMVETYRKQWHDDVFKVKLYVHVPAEVERDRTLMGSLRSLMGDVKHTKMFKTGPGSWRNIVTGNVHEPFQARGLFSPASVDFELRPDYPITPLPKDAVLVDIGYKLRHGVETRARAWLDVDRLIQQSAIAGSSGFGKTTFVAYLIHAARRALQTRGRKIGTLFINLVKQNQHLLIAPDKVYSYGNEDFQVPIFINNTMTRKDLGDLAEIIAANMGLFDVFTRIILDVFESYHDEHGTAPADLEQFFDLLKARMQICQYNAETQQNFETAMWNRARKYVADGYLLEATKTVDELPGWLADLVDGNFVYLDFSGCDPITRHLICLLILYLLRAVLPHDEVNILRYWIIIDEAHAVFEALEHVPNDSHDAIAAGRTEKLITNAMREDRFRGDAYTIIDQQISTLFKGINNNASIRFIFNVRKECAALVTTNEEELKQALQLKTREVFVNNGPQGERYFLKTHDWKPPKPLQPVSNESTGNSEEPTREGEGGAIKTDIPPDYQDLVNAAKTELEATTLPRRTKVRDNIPESTKELITKTAEKEVAGFLAYHERDPVLPGVYWFKPPPGWVSTSGDPTAEEIPSEYKNKEQA